MADKPKFLIQELYEMAENKDENGMSVFDEAKFRRELEHNDKFMARNKDIFRKGEKKFTTCKWYTPCPICEKCKVKASHLYVRCQNCLIPNCVHTHKDITTMIKRHNFMHVVFSKETKEALKALKDNLKSNL